MKRIMKRTLAVVMIASLMIGMFAGCSGSGRAGSVKNNGKTITIYAQKNGFKEAWLENAAKAYEEKEGTKVIVEFDAYLADGMTTAMESSAATVADLYFTTDFAWAKAAYNGYIIDMTEFMNEKGESGKSLIERATEQVAYIKSDDGSEKYYMVPFTTGASGFVYNKKMMSYICHDVLGWEDGHEYPLNTKELDEVLDAIEKVTSEGKNKELFTFKQNGKEVDVAPFVWSGTTGSLASVMTSWRAQWFGEEGMQEWYQQWDNCDMMNDEGFYIIYQKIVDMLRLEQDSTGTYISTSSISGCASFSHTDAQSQLILGKAVMCPTGYWFYSEMEAQIEDIDEWGYMPIPYMSDEGGDPITKEGVEMPKNENGEYMSCRTSTGEGFHAVIPTRSVNQEEAKNFLKFMLSETYMPNLQKDIQAPMLYEFDDSEVEKSSWLKASEEVLGLYHTISVVTGSKSQIYNLVGDYYNPVGIRPFARLAQSGFGSHQTLVDSANGKKINSAEEAKGVAVSDNVYQYVSKNYLNCASTWDQRVETISRY